MWKLSKNSINNMKDVNPILHKIVDLALAISPIDFGIPKNGGVRNAETQFVMFKNGLSKCDGTETLSRHQSGDALDFYAYVGRASWDEVHLAIVYGALHASFEILKLRGEIPDNVELIWGATFGSDDYHGWDAGHIELTFK